MFDNSVLQITVGWCASCTACSAEMVPAELPPLCWWQKLCSVITVLFLLISTSDQQLQVRGLMKHRFESKDSGPSFEPCSVFPSLWLHKPVQGYLSPTAKLLSRKINILYSDTSDTSVGKFFSPVENTYCLHEWPFLSLSIDRSHTNGFD